MPNTVFAAGSKRCCAPSISFYGLMPLEQEDIPHRDDVVDATIAIQAFTIMRSAVMRISRGYGFMRRT